MVKKIFRDINENEKWLEKVQKGGMDNVAAELLKVVELSKTINKHILNARDFLEGQQAKSSGLERGIHFHEAHEKGHNHPDVHRHRVFQLNP